MVINEPFLLRAYQSKAAPFSAFWQAAAGGKSEEGFLFETHIHNSLLQVEVLSTWKPFPKVFWGCRYQQHFLRKNKARIFIFILNIITQWRGNGNIHSLQKSVDSCLSGKQYVWILPSAWKSWNFFAPGPYITVSGLLPSLSMIFERSEKKKQKKKKRAINKNANPKQNNNNQNVLFILRNNLGF